MPLSLPRARLIDPSRNAVFAVPAIAASLFVFAYSTHFGEAAILLFYALWLPLPLLAPALLTDGARPVLLIAALPLLAFASTLWSDAPAATLRAAVQYGSTVTCGLIAARVVSLRNLAVGGLLGGLAILAWSWSDGSYGYDAVDASFAFQGAFQSKNQLGFYASLTLILALATALLPRAGLPLRGVACAAAAFALATLALTDSATSVLSLAGGGIAAMIVAGLIRCDITLRAQLLVLLSCAAAALAALALATGALDGLLAAFGKDPTLTGRTYLWNQGIRMGEDRPILGLGFGAFWLRGRPEAEDLWRDFYITARTGFHFHNTLIEAYVTLGLLGVTLVAGWLLALPAGVVRLVMNPGHAPGTALYTGLAAIFVIRSFVEIDFFTPYTTGSFLVPFLLLRMADDRRAVLAGRLVTP
jgi:exopolysaccharide production protein ExoQ